METSAGVELTEKQVKCVKAFTRLMKKWDTDLCINAIAGTLNIMLKGDTEQNEVPEMSDTGGFNPDNIITEYTHIDADGGDW